MTGLETIRAAEIPSRCLKALARFRDQPSIRVTIEADLAWVEWDDAGPDLVATLLPIPDARFFSRSQGYYYPLGQRLPLLQPTVRGESKPLDRLLFPVKLTPSTVQSPLPEPVPLQLIPDPQVRSASAMLCPLPALRAWADKALTSEINRLRGALAGEIAFVQGEPLPSLPGATRLWGKSVLIPLGYRLEPNWNESLLRTGLGLESGEMLVFSEGGAEIVPVTQLSELSRASIRLAERALLRAADATR